ncbi:hypothetical protein PIB30_067207 [Stylosanthes scabra]|uniref:DUF4283 domain-containing protein n=1 Tax=Stylosanthes scabra TaxID=79078 RepID=A0ABU6VNH9_9FABA|nr:hypothetical protein [Stylosanthes scabra]
MLEKSTDSDLAQQPASLSLDEAKLSFKTAQLGEARQLDEYTIEGKVIDIDQEKAPGYAPDYYNLVGTVITDKVVNFKVIKNSLLGMWGNPSGTAINDAGKNRFSVSFQEMEKGLHVLNNGLWNIKGSLLNLQKWNQDESIFEVNHNILEIWVQVHGIPEANLNEETTTRIGRKMGSSWRLKI